MWTRAVVAVLVIAVLVGLVIWSPWSGSEKRAEEAPDREAAPPPPKTVWAKITDGIRADGSVPADVALAAYAYTHDLDVPGVDIPEGVEGDDYPRSGSGAVRWLEANWGDLTDEQRRAILEENAGEDAATATSAGPGRRRSGVPGPDQAYRAFVDTEMRSALERLSQKLGLPPIGDFDASYSLFMGGNTLMETTIETTTYTLNGHVIHTTDPTPCNLTVYAGIWNQGLSSQTESILRVLLTHEAVHCYQNTIWNTPGRAATRPAWISEGTATYLATEDLGYGEPGTASFFRDGYVNLLYRDLFARNYDAVGYYALLKHLGRDLWGTMANAWRAAASSNDQSGAFISVLNGDAEDVRAQWGPSYARNGGWNDPWIMYGTGLPDGAQTPPYSQSISQGGGFTDQLESRSNRLYSIEGVADEVLHVATATGRVGVHDDDGHADYGFLSNQFCMRGDCVCPKNTPRAGEKVADTPLRTPFTMTFTSEPGGGAIEVKAESLEEACGKQRRREGPSGPPTSPPCPGGGCGQSNGDPHLITLDQTGYDFQAAGEFVLLRTDDFELQARQEPAEDLDFVSVNTAVAAKVGDERVGFYARGGDEGVATLVIDGEEVALDGSRDIDGGGSVAAYPGGYELDVGDGTKVYVVGAGAWGLNVVVVPGEDLASDAVGLLARTGGGFQVPALADGTELPLARDTDEQYELLYERLAGSWRVTDRTSLFDYEEGESTETLTVPDFPARHEVVAFGDIPEVELSMGADACGDVADTRLREQCTYDVAITGDTGYATSYGTSSALMAEGPTALRTGAQVEGPEVSTTTDGASTTTAPPSGSIEPVLTGIDGVPAQGVAIGPGGEVYVGTNEGARHRIVKIVGGEIAEEADVPNVGWVGFASGSVWVSSYGDDSCKLGRLDADTLEHAATIDAGCGFLSGMGLGPSFTVAGDAVWFTGADADGNAGMQRVDPRTNRAQPGVTMPQTTWVAGSDDAVFAFDVDKLFRLEVDGDGFDDWSAIAPAGRFFGDGPGIWAGEDGSAAYYESPGSPEQTVSIGDGSLVGAGGGYLYVERTDDDSNSTLWRIDASEGGTGEQVGPPLSVSDTAGNEVGLSYFADPQLLVGPDGAGVKHWVMPAADGEGYDLYLVEYPAGAA